MAEKVIITSAGKSLETALESGGLEITNISSEETLKLVLDELTTHTEKLGGVLKVTIATNADKKAGKEKQKEAAIKDPVAAAATVVEGSLENTTRLADRYYGKQKALMDVAANHLPKSIQSALGQVLDFKNAGGGLTGLLTATKRMSPALALYGGAILAVVDILGDALQQLHVWNKELNAASKVGASFNNSLIDMRVSAAKTGLSLEEFMGIIKQNTTVLSNYGGTVTAGAKAFAALSSQALMSVSSELNGMGVSVSEMNQLLPIYMDLTKQGAIGQRASVDKQAESFKNLIKETDTMSKMTGKSREGILKDVQTKQQDAAVQMKMASMSAESREKINLAMVRFQGQFGDVGADFVKLRMLGLVPMTDEAKLAAATMPGLTNAINGVTDSAMNQAVSVSNFGSKLDDATADAVVSAMESAKGMESVLAAGGAGMAGTAASLATIYKDITINGGKYRDAQGVVNKEAVLAAINAAKEEQSARDLTKNGLDEFSVSVKLLIGEIYESIIKPLYTVMAPMFYLIAKSATALIWVLRTLVTGIGVLLTPLVTLGTWASNFVIWIQGTMAKFAGWFSQTIKPALQPVINLFEKVTDALRTVYGWGGAAVLAIAAIVGGILLFKIGMTTAVVAMKAFAVNAILLAKGMASKIPIAGRLFGGAAASPPSTASKGVGGSIAGAGKGAGAGAAGLGKGVGAMMGSLGKGLGAGIGGLLTGVANGLMSLGNPRVLLGIVNMGLLAGVVTVFSYALGQFTDIDWGGVATAGAALGVLAIAAGLIGMPIFAVPIAIGAGVIGLLGLALLPFAAAARLAAPAMDTIMEALAKTKDISLTEMMGIGPAMVGMAAGMAALSAGGLVSGLMSSVGSLFGASSPFDKISELAKSAPGIVALARGLETITTALGQFSSINFEGVKSANSSLRDLATAAGVFGSPGNIVSIAAGSGVMAVFASVLTPFTAAAVLAAPALGTLMDSFGKIGELSLESIRGIGPALVSVAIGMAAITASGSGIAGSISGLLGAKSPLTEITQLSNSAQGIGTLADSLEEIGTSIGQLSSMDWGGITAVKESMQSFGSPELLTSLAGSLGIIAVMDDTLLSFATSTSAAAPAIDTIMETLTLAGAVPLDSITGLGPALMSMSQGLSALTSGGGGISGIMSSLGGLFGVESPLDSLTDLGLAAPGLISVASSMNSIKQAMESMPSGDGIRGVIASINSADTLKLSALTAANLTQNTGTTPSGGAANTDDPMTKMLEKLITVLGDFTTAPAATGESKNTQEYISLLGRIDRTLSDIKTISYDGFNS